MRPPHRSVDVFAVAPLARPAILIVDDFRPTLESGIEAFTRAGYAVSGVSDGRAVIEWLGKPLPMSDLLATARDALTAISGVEERAV